MTILSFSGFNQYAANTARILTSDAEAIYPDFKGVGYRWQYHNTVFNVGTKIPPESIDPLGRPWLHLEPISNITTSTRSITPVVTNLDIDDDLLVPGNIICFGFKFATCELLDGNSKAYIGYRLPSTSVVTTLTAATNFTIGPNQMRWIDYRFTVQDNLSLLIEIFSNKDPVYSFTAAKGTYWAVGVGNINGSLFIGPTNYQKKGFYMNDFLVILDRVGDESNTGMIGPITVKEIPVSNVQVSGDWKAPAGKTIVESLNTKRQKKSLTLDTSVMLQSDPFGKPLTATFNFPSEETKPILAMTESFIIQKPPSQASSMQWQRVVAGDAVGAKETITAVNNDDAVMVTTDIIFPVDGVGITPEEINGRGVIFNSVKKTISD